MPRPLADALQHIIDNIDLINRYTATVSEADMLSNRMLADAVERCIERISEASPSIPDDVKARYPAEPWRDIATIGNVLRHIYDVVDGRIIWRLVTHDLPSLRHTVETISASLPKP